MAGSKADYFEGALLNYIFGGVALSSLGSALYVALSTAAYSDAATGSSCSEVSGGSYARVAVTRNQTNFPAATGTSPTQIQNGTAITFPAASASWGTILSFYVCDAASGGDILYGGDLTASKTIGSGDTATFAASAITVTED